MKRKAIALLSVIVASSLVLSACGKKSPTPKRGDNVDKTSSEVIKAADKSKLPQVAKDRKDTLIVGITDPDGKFNSIYSSSVYDSYVVSLFADGLISNDAAGKPTPLVAKSWEVSPDGKTYTFTLNEGIKFTNGEEVTADDVAFTFTAIADPNYDGPRADAVTSIVGYDEYNKGDAATVSGIKVDGKYKISFTLKDVKAPAIYDFGFGIMPKNVYGFEKGNIQKLKDLFLKPVGCGAYKFVEFKPGQEVVMEKNKDYWRGEPKINKVIMKVTTAQTQIQELQAGGVDIDRVPAKPENVQMLKDAGFLDLQLYLANSYGYIGLNTSLPMFSDKKVRQALTYGLNRQGFVDAYYKGYASVANSPISPVSWAFNNDVNTYPYNKEKAKQLLDEAGWKLGNDGYRYKDGKKFTVHWMTYTGSKYVESLTAFLTENWKEIGVEVIPELMEFATLGEKVYDKQEFEMYNMAWSLSIDPDPLGIFGKAQMEKGGFNSVQWNPDESEKLMQEGVKETDQAKRTEIYKKWVKLVNDELPYIFVNQSKDMWAVSSRVKGFDLSAYVDWTYQVWQAEIVQ